MRYWQCPSSIPHRRVPVPRIYLLAAIGTFSLLCGCRAAAPVPGATISHPIHIDAQSTLRDGPHEIIVSGVRLWYRVAGTAPANVPPVVFLHGGPGQGSQSFAALVGPRLEPSLRMVYYDQRGSGLSGVETKTGGSRYTPSQRAKDWWLKNVEGYPVNVARD